MHPQSRRGRMGRREQLQAGPCTSSRGTKGNAGALAGDARVQEGTSPEVCEDVTGKMPIKVSWIDTNKQDEANPKYRSRLAAKEFKRYSDPDPFSSAPPIEMLRSIVRRAALGTQAQQTKEVARAYFNASSTSPVFLELCDEVRRPEDEGMCGELSVSMHGKRSAASNWQKWYTDLLRNCRFRVPRGKTCTFGHHARDIVMMVHGGDFVSTADTQDQRWLERQHVVEKSSPDLSCSFCTKKMREYSSDMSWCSTDLHPACPTLPLLLFT